MHEVDEKASGDEQRKQRRQQPLVEREKISAFPGDVATLPHRLPGPDRPGRRWGGFTLWGCTAVARLPGLARLAQSPLNVACLRACPISAEG
jgi:hypothetical protein